jgi:hypothetical protein
MAQAEQSPWVMSVNKSGLDAGNVQLSIGVITHTFQFVRDVIRLELNVGESLDEHVRPRGAMFVHGGRLLLK